MSEDNKTNKTPSPQDHVDAPVAWISKDRWEQMTAAETWLTNTVYSIDQSPSFPCIPLYAAGKSFEDGIRDAANLFITDPSEPIDDLTKLTREASRQRILALIGHQKPEPKNPLTHGELETAIEKKLWEVRGEEHAKLGAMLADETKTQIETNWQGGKVNGLTVAIEFLRFLNPSPAQIVIGSDSPKPSSEPTP